MSLRKALVIDDSKVAHMTLRKLLIERGMEVEWAASGEAGIEYLREHRPDVVFMDVMMPGMDGFEATALVTRSPDLHAPPIIMCSANATEDDQKHAHESGAFGFLSKPYTPEELGEVLAAVERQAVARPTAPTPAVAVTAPGASTVADAAALTAVAQSAARSLLDEHVPAMVRNVATEVASSVARRMIEDAEPVHKEMARDAAEETAHRVAADTARASAAESARSVAQSATRQALDTMLADLPAQINHTIEQRFGERLNKLTSAAGSGPAEPERLREQVMAGIEKRLVERIRQVLEEVLREPGVSDLLQQRIVEATGSRLDEMKRDQDLLRRALRTVEKSTREQCEVMVEERLRELAPAERTAAVGRRAMTALFLGAAGCLLGALALVL